MLLTSMWYCMMGVQLMVSRHNSVDVASQVTLKLTHHRSAVSSPGAYHSTSATPSCRGSSSSSSWAASPAPGASSSGGGSRTRP